LLSSDELDKLKKTLENDSEVLKHSFGRDDGSGRISRMALWNHPGKDITGMVARAEKVAGTVEKLLDGEVYHYHTKLMMKEAYTGGQFVWHQDYGYWYDNTCLFPDMATVFIAIDKTDVGNGCLKILKGSHKAGRIDHIGVGGQVGADLERVEMLQKVLPLVEVELEAGDALFFHCNLLHCSDQNNSDRRRWAFLIAYNKATNNPVLPHHHPFYTPLEKVDNSEILNCQTTDITGKDFMDPADEQVKRK
jgi:ectoine hydroxylase-related dioxygenase (phytanoyl-CoA dioxygenase family)